MKSETKDLLASKSFWGLIVLVASLVAKRYGITLDETGLITDLTIVAGLILNVYGRTTANAAIATVAGLPLPSFLVAKKG